MRKVLLVCLVLALCFMSVSAAKKRINVVGALGLTTSDFSEPCLDLGAEIQLSKGFFLQCLFNTHIGSSDRSYYYTHYHYSSYTYPGYAPWVDIGGSLHGLTAYAVMKTPLSKKVNFFLKGGTHFTFFTTSYYEEEALDKESKIGVGPGGGLGFEYGISPKFGIVAGGTYKYLFALDENRYDEKETKHWFKFYAGLQFRVR